MNLNLKASLTNKIEHIGIAVKSISSSNTLFAKRFGESHYKHGFESLGVKTLFLKLGLIKLNCKRLQIQKVLLLNLLIKKVFITLLLMRLI